MKPFVRNLLGVLLAAALIATIPASGEAASWWPWAKRNDRTAPSAEAPVSDPTATPATGDPASAAATDPTDRLARAEAKIRELNGQIEELTFQIRQLQDTIEKVQADNDYRLGQLEGGKSSARSAAASAPAPVPVTAPPLPTPAPAVATADTVRVIGPGAATEASAPPLPSGDALGRMVIDAPAAPGHGQPIDLAAASANPVAPSTAAGDRAAAPVMASLGDPGADYERAYGSILAGDYEIAEAAFRSFIQTYPSDGRSADAQYWLGESLFARGQYRDAADEFLSGYKTYPKSGKAADTLLKLGLSLAGLGERDAACSTYAEVLKKYPKASNALRQRVATEQALASC